MGATLARWIVASMGVASLSAAAVMASCGGDDVTLSPGAEAGVDTGGGQTTPPLPPGPEDDAGKTEPPTKKSACLALVHALVTRYEECNLGTSLRYLEDMCPDYQFADGSPRTIEQVQACANARRAQSCAELSAGRAPTECVILGTVPEGGACSFGTQCQSASCGGNLQSGACSECSKLLGQDAGCTAGNLRETCGYNLSCTGGYCQPTEPKPSLKRGDSCPLADASAPGCPPDSPCSADTPFAATGKCETQPPAGSACRFRIGGSTTVCAAGTACAQTSSTAGTCAPTGTAGASCGTQIGRACGPGLYCSQVDVGTCITRTPLNQACNRTDQCVEGSYCRITQANPRVGSCTASAAVGEACPSVPVDGGAPYSVACVRDATCISTLVDASFTRICVASPAGIGDACGTHRPCQLPLLCGADGKCAVAPCPPDGGT
jgi:hypothetical protein